MSSPFARGIGEFFSEFSPQVSRCPLSHYKYNKKDGKIAETVTDGVMTAIESRAFEICTTDLSSGYSSVQLSGTSGSDGASLAQISGKLYADGTDGATRKVEGGAVSMDTLAGETPDIQSALNGSIVTKTEPTVTVEENTSVPFTDVPTSIGRTINALAARK